MATTFFTCRDCGQAATRAFNRIGGYSWRCFCDDHGLGDGPDYPLYGITLSPYERHDTALDKVNLATFPLTWGVPIITAAEVSQMLDHSAMEDPGE